MSSTENTSLHVEIDGPCPANLPRLTPAERVRFCTLCNKDVHNLSAMTLTEANTLLDCEDDLCVSFEMDDAGAVVLATRPMNKLRRWMSMAATVAFTFTSQTGCVEVLKTPTAERGKGILEKISQQASALFSEKKTTPRQALMGTVARRGKRDKVSTALATDPTPTGVSDQDATSDQEDKPSPRIIRGRRARNQPR